MGDSTARDKYREENDLTIEWTPDVHAVRGDNRHCGVSESSLVAGFTDPRTHFRFTTGQWEWSGTKDGRRYYGVLSEKDVKVLMTFDRTGRKPKLPHTFTLTDCRSRPPRERDYHKDNEQRRRSRTRQANDDLPKTAKHGFGRFTIQG
jgi:hypothetical protein